MVRPCRMAGWSRRNDMGMIMLIAGAAGMFFCIVLLCVLPHIFEKQRKKLLGRISREREGKSV